MIPRSTGDVMNRECHDWSVFACVVDYLNMRVALSVFGAHAVTVARFLDFSQRRVVYAPHVRFSLSLSLLLAMVDGNVAAATAG